MKKTTLFVMFCIASWGCQEDKSIERQNSKNLSEGVLADSKESSVGRTKTSSQIFTDWSGQVQVLVIEQEFGQAQTPTGSITLPSDYVLIGGGAYTMYTETNAGGYITESRPDWNANTWIASSKDHAVYDLHSIDVFAIGLKIQGSRFLH